MKAVILLAGKGRRMQNLLCGEHKSLIKVLGHPVLEYLIKNVKDAGITDIVPIVGYRGDEVLSFISSISDNLNIFPAWNYDYETTNNLNSLIQAEPIVGKEEFVLINGDMVFDYRLLKKIIAQNGASIAVDTIHYSDDIDSPKVSVEKGVILDLGRHISKENGCGYAVGIYLFSQELAESFFKRASELVLKNPNMGFHDPLRELFQYFSICPCDTEEFLWMDIDEEEDIKKAEKYLMAMEELHEEV